MRVDQIIVLCRISFRELRAGAAQRSKCFITTTRSWGLASHLEFLNHDCVTKRTYMEMKTRILLLGILSILYGLFVTDRKYPRTDK